MPQKFFEGYIYYGNDYDLDGTPLSEFWEEFLSKIFYPVIPCLDSNTVCFTDPLNLIKYTNLSISHGCVKFAKVIGLDRTDFNFFLFNGTIRLFCSYNARSISVIEQHEFSQNHAFEFESCD